VGQLVADLPAAASRADLEALVDLSAVDLSFTGPGHDTTEYPAGLLACPSPKPQGLPLLRIVDRRRLLLLSRHFSRLQFAKG
jgi:hypothetical protein